MSSAIHEITPTELKTELAGNDAPTLVDVREKDELAISSIPGAKWIPMNEIIDRRKELDPNGKIVVICRSGARSANVTAFLRRAGFKNVRNLVTGVNGWAKDVDPSQPVY